MTTNIKEQLQTIARDLQKYFETQVTLYKYYLYMCVRLGQD